MPYEFQTVDISIFDFHAAVKPFVASNSIGNAFQFLIDPAAYNQQYQSGQTINTASLKIQPLRWRVLEYNHFWQYYKNCHFDGANPDFWKLQMPFICISDQKQNAIELDTGSPDFTGTVRSFVFLSGIGWSTNLDIRLRGQIKPEALRRFVSQLPGASLFKINGNSKSLTKTFDYFSDILKSEIYQPIVTVQLTIPRHFVITLSQFKGDVAHYRSDRVGDKQMPIADRALMHSILLGEEISFDELIRREIGKRFLLTKFNPPDFALSYFDRGTLIFMQQAAHSDSNDFAKHKSRRGPMRCHSSNIRNYLLMTLALQHFYRDSESDSAKSEKLGYLREDIKNTLRELPDWYKNPFCLSFHSTYGPLQKL